MEYSTITFQQRNCRFIAIENSMYQICSFQYNHTCSKEYLNALTISVDIFRMDFNKLSSYINKLKIQQKIIYCKHLNKETDLFWALFFARWNAVLLDETPTKLFLLLHFISLLECWKRARRLLQSNNKISVEFRSFL